MASCSSPLKCAGSHNWWSPFMAQNPCTVPETYLPISLTYIQTIKHLSIIFIQIIFLTFVLCARNIRLFQWGTIPAIKHPKRASCRRIKWPDLKSHKIRWVAFRSRCLMIILNKLFIHQLESNPLCLILHISQTKPTRNGTRTPWSSVVWLFKSPKWDGAKMVSLCSRIQWHSGYILAMISGI
jgi:hypothetical protein